MRVTSCPESKLYWICGNSLPGIGARRFYKLMEYYETPEQLFYATDKELQPAAKTAGRQSHGCIKRVQDRSGIEKARKSLGKLI